MSYIRQKVGFIKINDLHVVSHNAVAFSRWRKRLMHCNIELFQDAKTTLAIVKREAGTNAFL
jgi:hypothetical protein